MKQKGNNKSSINKELDMLEEIDPKIDIVFKNIFGKKGNEWLIEDMLSGILGRVVKCKSIIREGRIGEVTLNSKYGSLDLLGELDSGEYVDIDMQIVPQKDIAKRMVTYASYLTAENLEKNQNYSNVKKKIIIFLVDFNMYPEFNTPLHETLIVFRENREKEFTDIHKYYVVELRKIEGAKDNIKLYKWLAFLNQNKEVLEKVGKDKCIEKATEELKYLAGDPETRRIIQLKRRYIYDINTAKSEVIEETAIKMLRRNMKISTIIDVTGLSKNKVKELKGKLV